MKIDRHDRLPYSFKLVTTNGIITVGPAEAWKLADNEGLDLVLVDERNKVYKLLDWSKAQFQKKKQQKNQVKVPDAKIIKMTVNIEEADLARNIEKLFTFLSEGRKVTFTMKMHGREKARRSFHEANFKAILERIAVRQSEYSDVTTSSDAGSFNAVFSPISK